MKLSKNEIRRVTYKDVNNNIIGIVTENISTKIFYLYDKDGNKVDKNSNPNVFNNIFEENNKVNKKSKTKKVISKINDKNNLF